MATKREELDALAAGTGVLAKAADDEPIFILRAQDILAPAIVAEWATRAGFAGTPEAKVNEAVALAEKMAAWALINGGKVPD
jgi:hypothetical protein